MARKLASALMIALIGTPPSTMALGLGKLDASSALNEPLSARIPLLSLPGDDAASVRVSLAPADAFDHAGVPRPFYLSRLKFEVKQVDGEHYILISTDQPVKEPFLDFLLDVRWPQGNLQREYTVFLDPPRYSAGGPPVAVHGNQVSATQTGLRSTASPPVHAAAATTVVAGAASANRSTRYGPVQANQTLWSIAREVRPSRVVSVYQTMQAILRANPEAFIDGNVNAMLEGSVLRVPPRAEVAEIDAHQAMLQIQEQLTRWEKNHSRENSAAPPTQAGAQTAVKGQDKGGTAEAASIPATSLAQGGLHIVATSEDTEARGIAVLANQALAPTQRNILRLQRQLARVAERNAGLASTNEQLQQQASSLKKELNDLQATVDLPLDKSVPSPAAEQVTEQGSASSGAQRASAVDTGGETTSASVSTTPPAGRATIEHVADDRDAGPGAGGSGGAQSTVEGVVSASKLAPNRTEPAAATTLQAGSSFKTRLLTYLPLDAKRLGLLGLGLLLVLMLLWAVRRRSAVAQRHELPLEALASSGGRAAVTSIEPVDTAASFGRAAGGAQTNSAVDESAPLDEVEAHITHGRYDRAQELLDHALGERPDNPELRVKLLEVLAAQSDRGGFEAEAQVLHTQLADESDPYWQQAIQLARHIAPDHPLFNDALSRESEAETTAVRFAQRGSAAAATPTESTTAATAQAQTTESDFELSLSELALAQPSNPNEEGLLLMDECQESTVLEFDLGEIEAFASQRARAAAAPASAEDAVDNAADELGSLDFSLPEDWAAQSRSTPDKDGASDRVALQFNEFALRNEPTSEEGSAVQTPEDSMNSDETGTKLDLARAYLDMGDTAGARSLLSEVVTEGNAAQQGEAQSLLQQAG